MGRIVGTMRDYTASTIPEHESGILRITVRGSPIGYPIKYEPPRDKGRVTNTVKVNLAQIRKACENADNAERLKPRNGENKIQAAVKAALWKLYHDPGRKEHMLDIVGFVYESAAASADSPGIVVAKAVALPASNPYQGLDFATLLHLHRWEKDPDRAALIEEALRRGR